MRYTWMWMKISSFSCVKNFSRKTTKRISTSSLILSSLWINFPILCTKPTWRRKRSKALNSHLPKTFWRRWRNQMKYSYHSTVRWARRRLTKSFRTKLCPISRHGCSRCFRGSWFQSPNVKLVRGSQLGRRRSWICLLILKRTLLWAIAWRNSARKSFWTSGINFTARIATASKWPPGRWWSSSAPNCC